MITKILISLMATLAAVYAARIVNPSNTQPTIVSHSLINYGKINLSINLYGNNPDMKPKPTNPWLRTDHPNADITYDLVCPCSDFESSQISMPIPSKVISKVLRSNNLFKDLTSSQCCSSHEVPGNIPVLDLGLNNKNLNHVIRPFLPYILDFVPKSFSTLHKPMEAVPYPKRKDLANFDFTKISANNLFPKEDITIVGDKTLNNNVKWIPDRATSISKDLNETQSGK